MDSSSGGRSESARDATTGNVAFARSLFIMNRGRQNQRGYPSGNSLSVRQIFYFKEAFAKFHSSPRKGLTRRVSVLYNYNTWFQNRVRPRPDGVILVGKRQILKELMK